MAPETSRKPCNDEKTMLEYGTIPIKLWTIWEPQVGPNMGSNIAHKSGNNCKVNLAHIRVLRPARAHTQQASAAWLNMQGEKQR